MDAIIAVVLLILEVSICKIFWESAEIIIYYAIYDSQLIDYR
jgi:hypothetical protein